MVKRSMRSGSDRSVRRWELTAIALVGSMGGIAFGVSAAFGLYLKPITRAEDLKRQVIGLAVGLNFLLQGVTSIGWGALADTRGAVPVFLAGACLEVASLLATSYSVKAWHFYVSIPLEGLATGALSFSVVLGAVGKLVEPERRSRSLGLTASALSLGNCVIPPIAYYLLATRSWAVAMRLTALGCTVTVPLSLAFAAARRRARSAASAPAEAPAANPMHAPLEEEASELSATVRAAAGNASYRLLFFGFFVCGFHVFFVRTHLAAYWTDTGLPPWVGAASITLIGAGNVCGTFLSGAAASRWPKRKPRILSGIYSARSLMFACIAVNRNPTVAFALAISVVIGLLWLSTVPVTNALVVDIGGPRYNSTLFGIIFANHQVGSFMGAWLGGKVYDAYGSYGPMWWACVGAGALAALDHLPVAGERMVVGGAPGKKPPECDTDL